MRRRARIDLAHTSDSHVPYFTNRCYDSDGFKQSSVPGIEVMRLICAFDISFNLPTKTVLVRSLFLAGLLVVVFATAGCGGAADFESKEPVAPSEAIIPSILVDPARGAMLFANSPRLGQLACAECHSDNPSENNFGNIFAGRNAVALIQRAVGSNTGGMGSFSTLYNATDFADIAAYLGTAPYALSFPATAVKAVSPAQRITVSSSTKTQLESLTISFVGDFKSSASTCGTTLARFSSCTVEVVFQPTTTMSGNGFLVISHSGLPAPTKVLLAVAGK